MLKRIPSECGNIVKYSNMLPCYDIFLFPKRSDIEYCIALPKYGKFGFLMHTDSIKFRTKDSRSDKVQRCFENFNQIHHGQIFLR